MYKKQIVYFLKKRRSFIVTKNKIIPQDHLHLSTRNIFLLSKPTYLTKNQLFIANIFIPMKRIFYLITACTFFHFTLTAQWTKETDFGGDERDGAISFVINGTAYMGGGIFSNDFWKLNNTTKTWQALNTIADGSSRSFAAATAANGKAYVVGGDFAFGQPTAELWEYDPAGDSWTKKTDFPAGKRVGMVAFTINNRIFIGGGANILTNSGLNTVYNDLFEYIPTTDSWITLPALPFKAAFANTFVIGNDAYITLGSPANGLYNKNLYKFDATTNTWTAKAPFIGNNRNGGIAFSINGKGYAGLGQLDFSSTYKDVYEYNPATDTWIMMTSFPHDKTAWATAFVLNNTAYVGTGATPTLEFTKEIYSFSSSPNNIKTVKNITNIQAYPNPMIDELMVENIAIGSTITLADVTGKTVYTTTTKNETTSLPTASLANGIYILYTPQGNIKLVK